jgi:hypothetical protein
MEPSTRRHSILVKVAWMVVFVATIEACSSSPSAPGDAGAADRFPTLGTSYPCAAGDAGFLTCIVGQSYCDITAGFGGGSGTTRYPACKPIPADSPCAATPTCACLCASLGGPCDGIPCTCDEHDGSATLMCNAI